MSSSSTLFIIISYKNRLLFCFLIGILMGCAGVNLDRSLVNDPQMQINSSFSPPISPLSGLKSRSKSPHQTSARIPSWSVI